MTGIAGVTNIGNDRNWCGHLSRRRTGLHSAAWPGNHGLTAGIAEDWIRMTLSR